MTTRTGSSSVSTNGYDSTVSSAGQADVAESGNSSAMERTGRNSVLYLAGALMQGLGIFLV